MNVSAIKTIEIVNIKINMRVLKKGLPRECILCGTRIEKPTKYQKCCDECILKSRRNNQRKMIANWKRSKTISKLKGGK